MTKRTSIYGIVDENKTVIATTSNYKEAKRMLIILARYTEWNRNIKITEVKEEQVVFDTFDTVFIRELNYFSNSKDMVKALGFEDFTNDK